jgi:hypothetical protein
MPLASSSSFFFPQHCSTARSTGITCSSVPTNSRTFTKWSHKVLPISAETPARRLFGGRFIFLTSAIIEAETDEQIKFVIGHELGHHAAGHLSLAKNILKGPAHFVPFLGTAYSRSRELTCDRVGAYLSNDMQSSRAALQMLACGCRRLNNSLNCDAFEAQEKLVPPFWGWVSLIFARYPRTTQRVIAVSAFFAESGSLAYPRPETFHDQTGSTGVSAWTPSKG